MNQESIFCRQGQIQHIFFLGSKHYVQGISSKTCHQRIHAFIVGKYIYLRIREETIRTSELLYALDASINSIFKFIIPEFAYKTHMQKVKRGIGTDYI